MKAFWCILLAVALSGCAGWRARYKQAEVNRMKQAITYVRKGDLCFALWEYGRTGGIATIPCDRIPRGEK